MRHARHARRVSSKRRVVIVGLVSFGAALGLASVPLVVGSSSVSGQQVPADSKNYQSAHDPQVAVRANGGWQATPIQLEPGQEIGISYSYGGCTADANNLPSVTTAGYLPQVDSTTRQS
jgi:hypothetical protein